MTPADLRALTRVLGALLPWRTIDRLVDDPFEAYAVAEKLETAAAGPEGAGARGRPVGSGAATTGSATDARPAVDCLGWACGIFPARQSP